MMKMMHLNDAWDEEDGMNEEYLEELSDEELDELYRPKKINSRKSLLPVFVMQILSFHASERHPLSRDEIAEYLRRDPYDVEKARAAFGRDMNGLVDACIGIKVRKVGNTLKYWYDPDDCYTDYAAA